MNKENFSNENIAQWSEDAEIRFFENEVIAVDNYDTEVAFDKEKKFQAVCFIDQNANLQVVPYGIGACEPRSITLIDNGIGKIKQSPKGKNIKLEIILPAHLATSRAFTAQGRELLKAWTKWRKENQ